MPEHLIERAGVALSVEEEGEGTPVVLLHGLTATRRYVVMGSGTLQRSGHRSRTPRPDRFCVGGPPHVDDSRLAVGRWWWFYSQVISAATRT